MKKQLDEFSNKGEAYIGQGQSLDQKIRENALSSENAFSESMEKIEQEYLSIQEHFRLDYDKKVNDIMKVQSDSQKNTIHELIAKEDLDRGEHDQRTIPSRTRSAARHGPVEDNPLAARTEWPIPTQTEAVGQRRRLARL